MKIFKYFKHTISLPLQLKKRPQSGQSLVEFILLFSVIVFWGFLLLKESNGMIADYWEVVVKIIVNDSTQNVRIP